jgi:hypothetical protein
MRRKTPMAAKKQIGTYTITSVSFTPGPANSLLAEVNYAGTTQGFGTALGTVTFVVGKSGTASDCGVCYWDNGESSTYTGHGTYESHGPKWSTHNVGQLSNGLPYESEGEIDLVARTWTTYAVER